MLCGPFLPSGRSKAVSALARLVRYVLNVYCFFSFDLRRPGLWLIEVSGLVPQLLMDAPSRPGLLHSGPDLLIWILGPRLV